MAIRKKHPVNLDVIRSFLQENGINQAAFARLVGLAQPTISKIIHESLASEGSIAMMERAIGASVIKDKK